MAQPDQIDRFEIIRQLGRGGQGVVYLGRDPRLGREVAIKTLANDHGNPHARRALLDEARIVSDLQHPNIVTLYDAGEWAKGVYLVFEFVAGQSLAQRLEDPAAIEPATALRWIASVLDGLDYAHRRGVVHRDIKPSNIMIGESGLARLTDFGIALHAGRDAAARATDDAGVWGALPYLAPELLDGKPISARSDIYSMGLVLFEALTGRRAVEGRDQAALMYAIAHGERRAPSAVRPSLDRGLDGLCARAGHRQPDQRYQSAADMAKAIRGFMDDDGSDESRRMEAAAEQTTLKYLLRKISRNSDFPAFSRHITEINKLAASDSEATVNQLAIVVLKDYSLTNKLLRLVNSSYYGQFGGKVNTVSRAVTIVGFDRIRSLAMGLVLFEQIRDRPQADELVASARDAFISAAVARQMASGHRWRNVELYFVASLLYSMGRLMVIYYLPDEYESIRNLVEQKGMTEEAAAKSVLGVSFAALGRYIGNVWNFPKVLLQAMEPVTLERPERPADEDERVRSLSSFSNDLTQLLKHHGADADRDELGNHLKRYRNVVRVKAEQLSTILSTAIEEASTYVKVPEGWGQSPGSPARSAAAAGTAGARPVPGGATAGPAPAAAPGAAAGVAAEPTTGHQPQTEQRSQQLLNGINEITNMLIGDHSLNQILIAILEVAYSSLDLGRALLLIRDPRTNRLRARFGFGDGVKHLLANLSVPLDTQADGIARALHQGRDLLVEDTAAEAGRLPAWYGQMLAGASFAFYPLVVDAKLIGAIYVDTPAAGGLGRDANMHLQTLRNQATLAVRQRQGR